MGLKKKVFYTISFWFIFLAGYFLIQHTATLTDFTLLSEMDEAIPLMPEFIWVYHSLPIFIFTVMVLMIKQAGVFWRTLYSCIIAAIVIFAFYIALPIEYPRPSTSCWNLNSVFSSHARRRHGAQHLSIEPRGFCMVDVFSSREYSMG